jgi:hypothetical protein
MARDIMSSPAAVRDVGGRLAVGGTLYFLLIGVGFMMIDIGLL